MVTKKKLLEEMEVLRALILLQSEKIDSLLKKVDDLSSGGINPLGYGITPVLAKKPNEPKGDGKDPFAPEHTFRIEV